MNPPPLSLSDSELALVQRAASLLRIDQRDGFLRSLANYLGNLPYRPGITDVRRAITLILGGHGVAVGVDMFRTNNSNRTNNRTKLRQKLADNPRFHPAEPAATFISGAAKSQDAPNGASACRHRKETQA
jgi:hypothetical protein